MAKIKLNNNEYPIPDSALASATADFVAHLGTIAGNGLKVVINGVEYGIDAPKVAGAVSALDTAFGELENGGDNDTVVGTWVFNDTITIPNKNFEVQFTSWGSDYVAIEITGDVLYYSVEVGDETDPAYYFNSRNWEIGDCKTINIIEESTDPEFITWLKENAVKQEEQEVDSVVGTWMFNDTISMPSKNFEVNFVSNDTEYVAIEFTEPTLYYSEEVGDETEPVYSPEYKWEGGEAYRTITITEQPTDPEFITWLRANAARTVVGTWRFNETIEIPNKNFEVVFNADGTQYVTIEVSDALYYSVEVGDETQPAYSIYEVGGNWDDEALRTINIIEQPTDAEFITWLKSNAQFIGSDSSIVNQDGYLFYTSNGINYLVGYEGSDTELILPDDYNGGNYEIKEDAFNGCTSLTSVVIPDSVTSIGERAFYNCSNLTSITIPDSVTSIGDRAFYGCTSLTSVYYIADVTAWCGIAFLGHKSNPLCYAKNLYLNGELVTELAIPDSVTSIGKSAFYGYSSLTSVVIPDSVTSIGYEAFYGCTSLTSVEIGDSVTSIGYDAFKGCTSLTSITIPDSVTNIGMSAFSNCTSLTSITIPDSVTSIEVLAFFDCASLKSINFNGTKAQWNAITKGSAWNRNVPATHVQCSDGQVTL